MGAGAGAGVGAVRVRGPRQVFSMISRPWPGSTCRRPSVCCVALPSLWGCTQPWFVGPAAWVSAPEVWFLGLCSQAFCLPYAAVRDGRGSHQLAAAARTSECVPAPRQLTPLARSYLRSGGGGWEEEERRTTPWGMPTQMPSRTCATSSRALGAGGQGTRWGPMWVRRGWCGKPSCEPHGRTPTAHVDGDPGLRGGQAGGRGGQKEQGPQGGGLPGGQGRRRTGQTPAGEATNAHRRTTHAVRRAQGQAPRKETPREGKAKRATYQKRTKDPALPVWL